MAMKRIYKRPSVQDPVLAKALADIDLEFNNIFQRLGSIGAGDMTKAEYDSNDDGVVGEADYAAQAGDADTVDGKHSSDLIEGDGVAKITVGSAEPESPAVGDLWIDTSS